LSDGAVGKLVGTTKPTIQAIRERTHWNINNITPIDPVALGLCKQSELDTAVQAAARKKAAEGSVMSDDERRKLVSTEQSLGMTPEARVPSGFEVFGGDQDEDKRTAADFSDADSFSSTTSRRSIRSRLACASSPNLTLPCRPPPARRQPKARSCRTMNVASWCRPNSLWA